VLVLRRDLHLRQPILTYFDGSAASERALRLAVQLSEAALDSPVKVLLPAGPEQDVQQLRDAVLGRYARRIPRLHVRPLSDLEAQRLANVAANEGTGLVILPSGTPALEERPIQHVLYAIDRPTLVVR
jgi:nucleotide-binding universal stress UspA family protein